MDFTDVWPCSSPTFLFLSLAAVDHNVLLAVFVTADTAVLAAHTLPDDTFHLVGGRHNATLDPCLH